jgi:hypothetical protein
MGVLDTQPGRAGSRTSALVRALEEKDLPWLTRLATGRNDGASDGVVDFDARVFWLGRFTHIETSVSTFLTADCASPPGNR